MAAAAITKPNTLRGLGELQQPAPRDFGALGGCLSSDRQPLSEHVGQSGAHHLRLRHVDRVLDAKQLDAQGAPVNDGVGGRADRRREAVRSIPG